MRCDGSVLERCAFSDPVTDEISDVPTASKKQTKEDSKTRHTWVEQADCGDSSLCVQVSAKHAMCVLDAKPAPECATTTYEACRGSSVVGCDHGYVVDEETCSSCAVDTQSEFGVCAGAFMRACETDTVCAAGLSCVADATGTKRCTRACANDSDCSVAPYDRWAPGGQAPMTLGYLCRQGVCSFQ